MARPQRNNVDYFPFYCEEGKKMFYLEETYGNDGFAVFIKLLRELAKADYHYLDLSKKTTTMFLSAKCKVSNDILESIINDLVDLEKFNKKLWVENRIIWCQDFIDSIKDAYSKRINKCITLEGLLLLLNSLGVRKTRKSDSKVDINPQSKVEDTIVDEIKEYETIILDYIENNCEGFSKELKEWINVIEKKYDNQTSIIQIESWLRLLNGWYTTTDQKKECLNRHISSKWKTLNNVDVKTTEKEIDYNIKL